MFILITNQMAGIYICPVVRGRIQICLTVEIHPFKLGRQQPEVADAVRRFEVATTRRAAIPGNEAPNHISTHCSKTGG